MDYQWVIPLSSRMHQRHAINVFFPYIATFLNQKVQYLEVPLIASTVEGAKAVFFPRVNEIFNRNLI